jgi:hypothetical protein
MALYDINIPFSLQFICYNMLATYRVHTHALLAAFLELYYALTIF